MKLSERPKYTYVMSDQGAYLIYDGDKPLNGQVVGERLAQLEAELEKQRQISYDLAMSEAALVAKVNKLTKDSDED